MLAIGASVGKTRNFHITRLVRVRYWMLEVRIDYCIKKAVSCKILCQRKINGIKRDDLNLQGEVRNAPSFAEPRISLPAPSLYDPTIGQYFENFAVNPRS
jgi:hypothetical protein